MDEGNEIRAVFCDISKALDRIWHKGLFKSELNSCGIRFTSQVVNLLFTLQITALNHSLICRLLVLVHRKGVF